MSVSANQKKNNEISGSSYGTGKKTLGVPRAGNVTGSFKPPVAAKNPEPEVASGPRSGGLTDDRLKHLDPKMVELIQSEIMDSGAPVDWDDIAGLKFVKEIVQEMVIWPLRRPDLFHGLRGPAKGLLLFGPPGTGKTLIGKVSTLLRVFDDIVLPFLLSSLNGLLSEFEHQQICKNHRGKHGIFRSSVIFSF